MYNSKSLKILLSIFAFGFIVWLGGTVFRTTIAYNLFLIGPEMHLNPAYTNMERINTIYIFSITSLLTGVGYYSAVFSSIMMCILLRKEFRRRGWLFIAFILFAITLPIQIYFSNMDWNLAVCVYYNKVIDFHHPDVQKYFVQRYQNITNSSLRTIQLLASFTCILYVIWRPLDNKYPIKSNTE